MNNLALHGMYTTNTANSQVRPGSAQSTQNPRQFQHHYQQSLIRPGQQQQQHHHHLATHRQSSATLRMTTQNTKNVLMWTVDDVVVWLGQCCSVELQSRYAQTIRYHETDFDLFFLWIVFYKQQHFKSGCSHINGRALMRMDDEKLQLLGIENATHRYEIIKEIYKQQLRNHEKYFKELNQSLTARNGSTSGQQANSSRRRGVCPFSISALFGKYNDNTLGQ